MVRRNRCRPETASTDTGLVLVLGHHHSFPSQADSGFHGQGSDSSEDDEFGELPVAEVPQFGLQFL